MIGDLQLDALLRARQSNDAEQLSRVLDQCSDDELVELIENQRLAVEAIPKDYARKQQLLRVTGERATARAEAARLEALDADVAIVAYVRGVDDVEAAVVQLAVDADLGYVRDADDVETDELHTHEHSIVDGFVYVRGVTNEQLSSALLQTR